MMRHPLSELSLDRFMPSGNRTSLKRPLSPGATLLSPSKRRILSSEGLYSPEKKRHHTPSKQLFSDLSEVPPSPARKLDFTVLSHPSPHNAGAIHERDASPRPETPASRSSRESKLQPSPTIASGSSSDASASSSRDILFDPSRDPPLPPPMLIPREMPTFADRQSIHWPGFDVHADTHIIIPTSESIARHSVVMAHSEIDDAKENFRPKKRAGKRTALDDGIPIKSCKMGRTEKCIKGSEEVSLMSMVAPSPGQKTMTPQQKLEGRRRMRLIMELELDEDTVDDQL